MSLIEQIYQATLNGLLTQPFTTRDLKSWIKNNNIVNSKTNKAYANSSVNAILSNSNKANQPTTNLNTKRLSSKINSAGKKEYYF